MIPPNLLAPDDFSHFAVATGLPAESRGFITYDNLFWPGNAPPTASAYPGAGSVLDIYGLMFSIGADTVVDLYSNGVGFAASGRSSALWSPTTRPRWIPFPTSHRRRPEPSTWAMMVLGFAGLGFAGYRKARKTAAIAA